jgi:hypothetical protein
MQKAQRRSAVRFCAFMWSPEFSSQMHSAERFVVTALGLSLPSLQFAFQKDGGVGSPFQAMRSSRSSIRIAAVPQSASRTFSRKLA